MVQSSILVLLFFIFGQTAWAQTVTLSGTVRDASTGEALPAANIRIVGTSRGTITNADGAYALILQPGSYVLIYSFIGYAADTVRIAVNEDLKRDIRLKPTVIQMPEIVVSGEDPAYQIMRKVIENKHKWSELLKTYQFEAFTRQSTRLDTAIASIVETYTTGYWQVGDTLREVIKQRRQTENVKVSQNLAAVGGTTNFYDDEIALGGFRFVGPTSKDAFDYYDFKLLQTHEGDGPAVYTIQLNPKSRVVPLFFGTLNIVDSAYAIVGVEVTPNEVYIFPFVSEIKFTYRQQFALYEQQFWMPIDIRVKGYLKIGIAGVSVPSLGVEKASSIYDYKINIEIPDTVFRKPRRIVVAEADKFDSTFWAQNEVLPLTGEERKAYQTIDSTQTFERQLRPTGPLMALSWIAESPLRYFAVRFNRVEGLFAGVQYKRDTVASWLGLNASVGYGMSDKRTKAGIGARVFLDSSRNYSVGVEGHTTIGRFLDDGLYDSFSIALASLLSKNDYGDYFYKKGWALTAEAKPLSRFSIALTYTNESHRSALQRTDFSLFYRGRRYRAHPPINEGLYRGVRLKLRYGGEPFAPGIITTDYVQLETDYSDRSLLRSQFEFNRYVLRAEWHQPTLLTSYLFPPTLYLRLVAGTSGGQLPAQFLFGIDSQYSGLGPFGTLRGGRVKEFAGGEFVVLSAEHNFRSVPFLALNIPFLYKNGIEILTYATAARMWSGAARSAFLPRLTDGWYYEAGIGLSRILGLLRVDVTRRFASPRTTVVTLGVARIL